MNNYGNMRPSPAMNFLFKYLYVIEFLALLGTAAGLYMRFAQLEGNLEILMVSLSVFAAAIFIRGFQPLEPPSPKPEDQPEGFSGLLGSSIAPKVMCIASAVIVDGILFSILGLKGADQMLIVGGGALTVALALSAVFLFSKPVWLSSLMPVLYRAVPVWIAGVYLLVNKPA